MRVVLIIMLVCTLYACVGSKQKNDVRCNELDEKGSKAQLEERYCVSIEYYMAASKNCAFSMVREHQLAILFSITDKPEESKRMFKALLKRLEDQGDAKSLDIYKKEYLAAEEFISSADYKKISTINKCDN